MTAKALPQDRRSSFYVRQSVTSFAALLVLAIAMTAALLALTSHSGGAEPVGGRRANGEPNPTVDVTLSEFSVTVSQFATAPPGNVTFIVKNAGSIDHEMLVLKTGSPVNKLPIVDGGDPPVRVKSRANKVDEGTNIGETGDPNLKPGETRTFTVKNMTPGTYVLVCNLAMHYGLGMRAAFTVR